jgi:hypothetical protein
MADQSGTFVQTEHTQSTEATGNPAHPTRSSEQVKMRDGDISLKQIQSGDETKGIRRIDAQPLAKQCHGARRGSGQGGAR